MSDSSPPDDDDWSPLGLALSTSHARRGFDALAALLHVAARRGATPALPRQATEALADALSAATASVWLYEPTRARCLGADRVSLPARRHEVPEMLSSREVTDALRNEREGAFYAAMYARDGIVGVVCVERGNRAPFSPEERKLVAGIADVLALTYDAVLRARAPSIARRSSAPPPPA